MALSSNYVRIILREHKKKPLVGPVMQLGRQNVPHTFEQMCEIFRSEGVKPVQLPADLNIEPRVSDGFPEDRSDQITDTVFFAMLGITDVESLDFSEVGNPNYIVDLNDPVSDELHNKYSLIVDGGTFDHLFDMKQAFSNVANMLKVGGRVVQWNACSNFLENNTYFLFSPSVFLDFYELNKFKECRAFVAVMRNPIKGQWDLFQYTRNRERPAPFTDPRPAVTIVWAEKTEDSSSNVVPTQDHWLETPQESRKRVISEIKSTPRWRLHEFRLRHRSAMAVPYAIWWPIRTVINTTQKVQLAIRTSLSPKKRPPAYRFIGKI